METDDDEPLSFLHIAAATANVIRYLQTERARTEQDGADNQQRRDDERKEQEARAKLALVKRRLSDLAAFERRARGEKN